MWVCGHGLIWSLRPGKITSAVISAADTEPLSPLMHSLLFRHFSRRHVSPCVVLTPQPLRSAQWKPCCRHMVQILPLASLAYVAREITAATSEEILRLKSVFANPNHGPWHNGGTCVQCIPGMPAGKVPYQSLQLFWCVGQKRPCPPTQARYVQPLS